MNALSKLKLDAAQVALDQLAALTTRIAEGDTLTHDELQAVRAAADAGGRAAACALGLTYEGERQQPADRLDWIETLGYVADPF